MKFFVGAAFLSLLPLAYGFNSTSAAASSTATATPSCLQPRQVSDPASTAISTALKDAIPNACDTTKQRTESSSTLSLVYYKFGSVFFNISHDQNTAGVLQSTPSACSDNFNSLLSACVNAPNPGFWEGWVVSSGNNYSISNFIYPGNPLPSAVSSSSSAASSGSATQRPTGPSAGLPWPSSTLLGTGARAPSALSSSSQIGTGTRSSGSLLGTGNRPSSSLSSTAPPYPVGSQLSSNAAGGSTAAPKGTDVSTKSSAPGTGAPPPTSTGVPALPLPSLATVITGNVGSQVVTETFVPHIFPQYATITGTITTTTTLSAGASPVSVVVGPGGVGWAPYREPSGALELPPPAVLPPSAVAALDSENSTTAGVQSASVPLGTGVSSRTAPVGTGVGASSSSSAGRFPIGTGVTTSTAPIGTGVSASSKPNSPISLGTGFGGSSLSISNSGSSGSVGKATLSASVSSTAAASATSYGAIVPVGYVTTAFNNPSQTITTLSVSGSAAIIYSKETFPGLASITTPMTVQTSLIETDKNGKTSTFIGAIVVGPGGVYWGPPGLPPIPPFPGISPPCIWPFCK